jgi:ketosteroid isomerase-like protein
MSEENLQILRALDEAWNGKDFESGVIRYFDPEVEFNPGLLPPGEDTHYLGREGVMDWIGNVNDAWKEVTVQPGQRIDIAGDRVLAIDRWHFEGRDGIQVEEELPTVFTFRDGLIVRVDGFTDKAEALEAVGLSE